MLLRSMSFLSTTFESMSETNEPVTDEELDRVMDSVQAQWSGVLELLSKEWECERGECPECAAKQARGD